MLQCLEKSLLLRNNAHIVRVVRKTESKSMASVARKSELMREKADTLYQESATGGSGSARLKLASTMMAAVRKETRAPRLTVEISVAMD